jgi:hypothetical protein
MENQSAPGKQTGRPLAGLLQLGFDPLNRPGPDAELGGDLVDAAVTLPQPGRIAVSIFRSILARPGAARLGTMPMVIRGGAALARRGRSLVRELGRAGK